MGRWSEGAVAAGAFGAALAFGLHRVRFGIDDEDEGFYLAAPLRLALGDLPFRDEILNPNRMFDVLEAPLFCAAPDLGVLALRQGWMAVELGVAIALYLLLRRFAPPAVVALACAVSVWLPNLIWTPGYHTMGASFFVLAFTLWLRGCLARGPVAPPLLGTCGGLAFGLGAVSYMPLLALLAVPGAVLTGSVARRGLPIAWRSATLAFLASFLMLAAALFLVLAQRGLLGDWLYAYEAVTSELPYASPWPAKLAGFLGSFQRFWLVLAISLALPPLLCLALRQGRRLDPMPLGVGLGAAAALSLGVGASVYALCEIVRVGPAPDSLHFTLMQRVFAILLGILTGSLLTAILGRRGAWSRESKLVLGSLLAGTLALAALHGMLSGNAFKVMFALLPMTAGTIAVTHRACVGFATGRGGRLQAGLSAAAICGGLSLAVVPALLAYNYRGLPLDRLDTEFSHPLLRGILSDRAQVQALDDLAGYVSGRVDRGDYLLVYDHMPLLYYLTGTRPAIDHAWTYARFPLGVRERSVERMIERGRIPTYAVKSGAPSFLPNVPLDRFVGERYELEARIGRQEVWRLRREAASGAP